VPDLIKNFQGTSMNTYYLCIGLLFLLLISLGMLVTVGRGKFNVLTGHSLEPEDTLNKWVRAHANTTEYVPALMVVIYILSLAPQAVWVDWFVMLVTLSRYLIALGIILPKTMSKPNPLRFAGALGTYVFGLGLCIAIFQQL
jgi:hypothetical protein